VPACASCDGPARHGPAPISLAQSDRSRFAFADVKSASPGCLEPLSMVDANDGRICSSSLGAEVTADGNFGVCGEAERDGWSCGACRGNPLRSGSPLRCILPVSVSFTGFGLGLRSPPALASAQWSGPRQDGFRSAAAASDRNLPMSNCSPRFQIECTVLASRRARITRAISGLRPEATSRL
jgi:hypothetical protein